MQSERASQPTRGADWEIAVLLLHCQRAGCCALHEAQLSHCAAENRAGEMQASCIRPFCRLALSLVLAGLSLYAVLLQPTAQLVRTELVRVV